MNAVVSESVMYCVDDASFAFMDESHQALHESFTRFLELLDYVETTGCGPLRWSDVWFIESASGRTLSSWLFESSEVDPDLRRAVGVALDRMRCWDEESEIVPPDTVQVDGKDIFSPGISWSLMAFSAGYAVGCLAVDQAGRRGEHLVTDPATSCSESLFFLVDASQGPQFWRHCIECQDAPAVKLEAYCVHAFPRLQFAEGIFRQIANFKGQYRDVRPQLLHNLAGLNDYAVEIWSEFVQPNRIQAEMRARAGVDCSPESPSTHRNASAMRLRRVVVDGAEVTCEWHAKLEPHRNRVHFHVQSERIIVGLFAEHLPV